MYRPRLLSRRGACAAIALATAIQLGAAANAQSSAAQRVGRTPAESGPPRWPLTPQAPAGAPNILLIMTDDVGFGASSTFGGPIPTPHLEALAQQGVRYNNFNTTALCSPTRAALLTGRNPHAVGMGNVTNLPTGYPGYTSVLPKSAGTVAEVLKQAGYNTAMFGKAHITPEWETSRAGPFDRWPTGLGFEYFYGFLSGDTDQWAPNLYENTTPVTQPRKADYLLDEELADKSIEWLRYQHALAPNKPFFLYFAPGTAHAPHHAPKEWLARFRGKFDQGWDVQREQTFERQRAAGVIPSDAKLTPRPDGIPAWTSLTADQRRLASRLMEAYAASLAYCDEQVGRVLTELRQSGQLANTFVIFVQGDNGSSAEGGMDGQLFEQSSVSRNPESFGSKLSRMDEIGGPTAYNHFPVGWAWAMNAPFRFYKQVASHFGGTRNGLVMAWPSQILPDAKVRPQFHYVTDIMPTVLEAAKTAMPNTLNGIAQQPLDGLSMSYTFNQPAAPSKRHTQIFEMMENFGVYHDGWVAAALPQEFPWTPFAQRKRVPLDQRQWVLYDTNRDFSENDDLAAKNPQKLAELKQLFWTEAARSKVLPIHYYTDGAEGRPSLGRDRKTFRYYAGMTRIPEDAAPHTIGRSYRIDADVDVGANAQGVIVTQGGRFGGYAFYLKDGRPTFHYNAVGEYQYKAISSAPLKPGHHRLTVQFHTDRAQAGSPGTVTLLVDGVAVGTGRLERTISGWLSYTEGLDVGEDTLTPVNDDYTIANSGFSGKLNFVDFNFE